VAYDTISSCADPGVGNNTPWTLGPHRIFRWGLSILITKISRFTYEKEPRFGANLADLEGDRNCVGNFLLAG